ncbi:peroxisomal membrane protein PMP47B [Achaetomium macrosporum]|uniref:Peroxisomal membrane protein PMP47B n=1 Tax=Achaetomium macrosporum TaxID=79813 RepID=A0AAN7CCV3_9PEZI|nr:peroxisomal membrane protein PMP47B [Achaetomium macrosporum]
MSHSKPVLPQNDNVAHALAGAGGGVLSMALTYPLITLSTRAQVESKRAETAFLATVQHIVAREGISGLYSGMSSALFGISVTNFVYYYWYEWTRAFFEAAAAKAGRASKKLTTVESMIAGAIAGSATVILTNPIWVVNTRMTARKNTSSGDGDVDEKDAAAAAEQVLPGGAPPAKPKRPSTIGTLLSLLRKEGPQALFAGVVPALVLVINPILQYTLFEQMKNAVEKRRRVTPTVAFFLGALGKLFATTVTYPYITVKSQMHVAKAGEKKEGVTEAIRRVIKEEGYAGLYKGIGPKVTQSVLTAAFLFAFKDVLYAYSVRLRSTMAKKAIAA